MGEGALMDFPLAGRKTTVEPAARIKSPAFRARYPDVRNLDLINPGARAAMEVSWCRDLFDEQDVEIFQIRGAFFSEECLVFDDHLQVITNASDEYSDEEIDRALARILKTVEEQKMPHLVGPGVVSKRRAVNNYGHFLIECLPMAVIGGAVCGDREPTFLLQRVQPAMLDVMLRAFRLLGAVPGQLEIRDYGEPMHFEEAHRGQGPDPAWHLHVAAVRWRGGEARRESHAGQPQEAVRYGAFPAGSAGGRW